MAYRRSYVVDEVPQHDFKPSDDMLSALARNGHGGMLPPTLIAERNEAMGFQSHMADLLREGKLSFEFCPKGPYAFMVRYFNLREAYEAHRIWDAIEGLKYHWMEGG